MTLEQLSLLAQIGGAIGILASLIFVGLQIRQNTQSQRIVAVESLAASIAAINVPAMQSPLLGTALAKTLKDWRAASHDERVIAHYFLFCFFKLHEQAWYQHKWRVLEPAQWTGWENLIRAYYHSPESSRFGGQAGGKPSRSSFRHIWQQPNRCKESPR